METQPAGKVEKLARASLTLGTLSSILLIILVAFLMYAGLTRESRDLAETMAFVGLAMLLILGILILEIPGLITGFIALRRIKKQGNDNMLVRKVKLSLVLNGLGIAFFLIFFVVVPLLGSPMPPPEVLITPSPLIP